MSNVFFITGLPRSRTAWLANFFTTGPVLCYHDVIKDVESPEGIKSLFESSEYPYVGDSDSALLLHLPKLRELFPAAKWVFVHRDPQECLISFNYAFRGTGYPGSETPFNVLEKLFKVGQLQMAKNYINSANVLDVPFKELENRETVKAIWEFLLPDLEFPEERWKMLNTFRVEIIPEKVTFSEKFLEVK